MGALKILSHVLLNILEKKGLWTEEDTARVKEEAKAKVNEEYQKSGKNRENDGFRPDRQHVRKTPNTSGRAKSKLSINDMTYDVMSIMHEFNLMRRHMKSWHK